MLLEPNLQGEENVPLLSIRIRHGCPLEGQLFRILYVGIRRLCDRLAGILGDHRLGIKALQMAQPAIHEQPDHTLGFRRKMRQAGWR